MGSDAEAVAVAATGEVLAPVANASVSKKTMATWKKQIKNLKTKDSGKKADGLSYCARDDRFFREQSEVLPLMIGFLSRVKTPEVIVETLRTFNTLFSPPGSVPDADARPPSASEGEAPPPIDPAANIRFVIDASCVTEGRTWNGGDPFVQLIGSTVAPEIKVQAIQVLKTLLRACLQDVNSSEALQQYQSAGSPSVVVLGCLAVDHIDLQLAALECLSLLFHQPSDDGYLTLFDEAQGLQKLLPFMEKADRRCHRPVLEVLESFSHHAIGREHLRLAGVPVAIKTMLQSALDTTNTTLASATATPATPISLTQDDATVLHWTVAAGTRVFARCLFAKECTISDFQSSDYTTTPAVIDVVIAVLQRDINTIVSPIPPPAAPTGNNAAAQAAAAAALATFNSLAQLFPFSSSKCVDLVTSIGRMIEASAAVAQYAKDNGLLAVLVQAYRIPAEEALHQSVDKLLHLCAATSTAPNEMGSVTKVVDPQLFNAVPSIATGDEATPHKPALLSVETVNSILDANVAIASADDPTKTAPAKAVVFRLVRWLAFIVDAPANALALKELTMGILVKILLDTPPEDVVLSGLLSKCIQAIAMQSADACELCSSDGRNPIPSLLALLHSAYPPVDPMPLHKAVSMVSEIELFVASDQSHSQEMAAAAFGTYALEFVNESSELSTFAPKSLTAERQTIDAMFYAAKAIETFATAHARSTSATPRANGESGAPDFAELLAARLAAANAASAMTTAAAAKKKPGDASLPAKSPNSEAIVVCVLEKAPEVFKLLCAFCSKSAEVAVSLLTTMRTLVQLPKGVPALLSLAKTAMQSTPQDPATAATEAGADSVEQTTATTNQLSSAFPWTAEEAQRSAFAWLLAPVVRVFETPVTCFFQMEAAVALLNALIDTQETDVAVPPPSLTTSHVEISVSHGDRFANVVMAQGLLLYLIAVLDNARVPRCPNDLKRRQLFASTVTTLVVRLIAIGSAKQAEALARKHELISLHEQAMAANATVAPATASGGKQHGKGAAEATTTQPSVDLLASINEQHIAYKQRWATELLDATFDVPRFGYRRVPALLLATQISHDAISRALLEAGATPDVTSSLDSTTPLMLALLTRNHTLVQALLQVGASVDAITRDGCDFTVWCCALTSPIREDVSSLLSRTHASIAAGDRSPLEGLVTLDAIGGTPDVVIFEKLLELGLDVNVSNAGGDFVLHALLSKCVVRKRIRGLDLCFRYDSTLSLGVDTLRFLIGMVVERYHGDVDACNRLGQTPLHVALLHGHGDIAAFLLESGANPNIRDSFGLLPIHYACLGLFTSEEQAIEVIDALLRTAVRFEAKQGVHCDQRKYKTSAEKARNEVEQILDDGLVAATAPPAITTTLATAGEILATVSALPDGFLPWHLACGACSHLNGSSVCLSDDMQRRFLANGAIRAAILTHLVAKHGVSIETRTAKQLTGLHLAVKTDVEGNNAAVVDVLLASRSLPAILNAVHEPTLVDTLQPMEEGSLVEVTTSDLLYVPHAHVSTRSLQHQYHVILPDGTHLADLSRDQLKISGEATRVAVDRYTLHMESAFSALHYALQTSDEMANKLLAIDGIALQLEGCDLPLLALACAARRGPEVVRRLVNPQVNVRVHLPLHDGTSHEQSTAGKDTAAVGASGGGGGGGRAASRKQAAALHYAVIYEDADLVRALVERKEHTNVNVRRSGDGFTPLHLACEMGNIEIIKLLLDHGANFIQMSTVSSSSSGVTPLHLLLKSDGMENEMLKHLIQHGYIKREMLLEGLGAPATVATSKKESEPRGATGTSGSGLGSSAVHDHGDDQELEISCVLLDEEEHNLSLYNHVEQRLAASGGGGAGFRLRLQTELAKSDEVLLLFFDLISGNTFKSTPRNRTNSLTLVSEEDAGATDTPRATGGAENPANDSESVLAARHQFAQLKHWHECYAQQKVRSRWVASESAVGKTLRRSSFDRRSTSKLLELTANDADTKSS